MRKGRLILINWENITRMNEEYHPWTTEPTIASLSTQKTKIPHVEAERSAQGNWGWHPVAEDPKEGGGEGHRPTRKRLGSLFTTRTLFSLLNQQHQLHRRPHPPLEIWKKRPYLWPTKTLYLEYFNFNVLQSEKLLVIYSTLAVGEYCYLCILNIYF